MKIKKLALLVLLFVIVGQTKAQDYAFRVLVNKGKSEFKAGDGWSPIKVGTNLKKDDEVKVTENAYIGLAHVSGKTLELKQPGKYKVADLAGKVSGGSSVLNKYTDFILSSNSGGKKNNLAATGAVTREVPGDHVQLYLPPSQSALIYNDAIIINWDNGKIAGPYIVRLNSLFDDELAKIETGETSVKINLADPNFINEDNIQVTVTPKNDPNKVSFKGILKRLSKADKERIKISLNEIAAQTAEETALNKLVMAGFYEQNNLLIDATTAYLEAIKLAPDVPEYKEAYNDFLVRNGIKATHNKK
jgi:hypothetical protein